LNDEGQQHMVGAWLAWLEVGAAQLEAPEEPEVRATQQEAFEEPEAREAQQLEVKEVDDQPWVTYRLVKF
jgi:hypothetical protein